MARKDQNLFQIGDAVTRKYDGRRCVVIWVSKGARCREEQLIATQFNSYCHPVSDASVYEGAA